jgi:hypothetical protein
VVLYPDQSGIGEFKFSAAQAGAAARLYVACGTSYEKTVEALLYGHQFWTEKAVEGDFLPSESTLSNWVTAIGQVEWERMAEVCCTVLNLAALTYCVPPRYRALRSTSRTTRGA